MCHFSPQLPILLQVDVSSVGVGGGFWKNFELVAKGKRLSDEKRKWCKLIFQVSLLYFVLLRSGTKHDYVRRKENGRKKNFPRQKTTEKCVLVLKKIFQSSFQVNVT